jgi:hypothetical protein
MQDDSIGRLGQPQLDPGILVISEQTGTRMRSKPSFAKYQSRK